MVASLSFGWVGEGLFALVVLEFVLCALCQCIKKFGRWRRSRSTESSLSAATLRRHVFVIRWLFATPRRLLFFSVTLISTYNYCTRTVKYVARARILIWLVTQQSDGCVTSRAALYHNHS